MTKTNAQTATKTRAAKAKAAPAATKAAKAEAVPAKPAKAKKVLTDADFSFPTDKEIRAELEADLRKSGLPRAAQLARGVAASAAPHSAKAVSDSRAKANNKVDAATQKPAKAKAAKADKAEAKKAEAAKAKGNRPYKWIGENKAREGTWRHAMLDCLSKNKDKDSASACMRKHKEFSNNLIDFRWSAAQGYIAWTD